MTVSVIVPHVGAGKGGDSSFHSSAAALSRVVGWYGWIGFPAVQQTVSGVLLESSLESWNSPLTPAEVTTLRVHHGNRTLFIM